MSKESQIPNSGAEPVKEAQIAERGSLLVFGGFGSIMMLLALVLPFVSAERELRLGMTIAQVLLWGAFCSAWLYQGYLAQKSGMGFSFEGPQESTKVRWREIALYLFVFGPLCHLYIYVTVENTGYFGFNYVLLFVLAGFSTVIFRLGFAFLYLVYQCATWVLLGHFMWGGWMDFENVVTMFSGFLFSAMMFFVFRQERSSRGRAYALSAELDRANEKLRRFSRQVEELAATQERNRIAREIHDTIGHSLTVVNMQIETAKALIDADKQKAKIFLDKAQEVTKKGLAEIRSSVASLRSSPLAGKSLSEALEELLRTSFGGDVETRFEARGEISDLSPAIEAALYRSAQEAFTNVRKHAEAKLVTLVLDGNSPNQVRLIVRDDGKGSDEVVGGFGIMGIRERMQLLGGELHVSSSLGHGLELTVNVPV